MSNLQKASESSMTLAGHQRLAKVIHLTLSAPPIVFVILCYFVIPWLPPTEKRISFMPFFLGFSLLCAVVVDSLTFMRLRKHIHPIPRKMWRFAPPVEEMKRGWTLCLISWGLANLYGVLGAFEAIGMRDLSKMVPFIGLSLISLIRCRPRMSTFIAPVHPTDEDHV